ncbi:MAG: hypothetical protein KA236_16010, partial [Verrucomicrobia bacterium]|nr:hypothetical protein [Verrucomicrobiota bacterium]
LPFAVTQVSRISHPQRTATRNAKSTAFFSIFSAFLTFQTGSKARFTDFNDCGKQSFRRRNLLVFSMLNE